MITTIARKRIPIVAAAYFNFRYRKEEKQNK